jgi:hypothetical protein
LDLPKTENWMWADDRASWKVYFYK